jgi:hypothetical protein
VTTEQIHVPGFEDDEDRLLNHLLKQLDAKAPRNMLRASYYDGKRAIKQVGTVIPPQYYRLGIVLGWSAKAVDILARRCNLDGFVWSDGDLNSLGAREVWDANFLASEINSGMVSSLIHSVAFLVNTEGQEDEPESLIHVKDAMNATGDWNWRARRLDNLLSITDRDGENKPTGLVLYLDGETVTAIKDLGRWAVVDRTEHPWGVPAEPLVYKPRVGRPFGSSRISRPVMSLHDQALRTVIRLEGHADVFSYPEMWMLGADPSMFKDANGNPKPVWQTMLGRIKGIPDDDDAENPRADVKQFQAQSPTPHIETLKQQAQLFSGETSIPLTSLGVSDMSNPTSSDSYIASREDLISEAEGATDDWAPALRRTMIRALAIQNGLSEIPADWATVDTKWRSPIHLSRAAQADAGMKVLTAVPWLAETEVALEILGLSDQQITRAMSERRRAVGRNVLDTLSQRIAAQPPLADQTPPEDADANAG